MTVDQPSRAPEAPPAEAAASSDPARLHLTGISKRFGAVRAIRNADITIRAGRVHALVGENGAGKSTMIKIISGVEAADTGTIEFEGRPVTIASTGDAMALGIATVYQEPQLFAELTVSENIFTGREIRRGGRIAWAEQNAKVVELLELLGLPARYATVPVGTLSHRRAAAGVDREGAGGRGDRADPGRALGDPDRRRDRRAVRRRPPPHRVRRGGHLHLAPARRAVPDRRRGHGDARRADDRHLPDRRALGAQGRRAHGRRHPVRRAAAPRGPGRAARARPRRAGPHGEVPRRERRGPPRGDRRALRPGRLRRLGDRRVRLRHRPRHQRRDAARTTSRIAPRSPEEAQRLRHRAAAGQPQARGHVRLPVDRLQHLRRAPASCCRASGRGSTGPGSGRSPPT